MTWFNFFKKEIVVDCYTSRADVFNFSPIQKANKHLPSWWKALPKTVQKPDNPALQVSTMKHCAGFTDLFSKGFMLPLWSDLSLTIGGQREDSSHQYRYQFADGESYIDHHAEFEWGGTYPLTHYQHLKMLSPWRIVCNEDINFLVLQPTWTIKNPEEMFIPPGMLNFKYQCGTNINMFYKRKPEDTVYMLEHGQPLLHFVPLTERKIKLQLHLVSEETLKRIASIGRANTFINKYKNNKRILKESKCPFNFAEKK